MLYLGDLVFKEVHFSFGFNGKRLDLTPVLDKDEAARELTMRKIGSGVWALPGDPIEIDEDYLILRPRNALCSLVVFPDCKQFRPVVAETGSMFVGVRSYFSIFSSDKSVSALKFQSLHLGICYDIQSSVKSVFSNTRSSNGSVELKQIPPTSWVFTANGETVAATIFYATKYVRSRGEQPLQIESILRFEFKKTEDYSFIDRLVQIANAFLAYCLQASDVCFDEVELLQRRPLNVTIPGDGASEVLCRMGDVYAESDCTNIAVEFQQGTYLPLGRFNGLEAGLSQNIADNLISFRHLPTWANRNIWDCSRCILLAASFDYEFGRLYPNGIRHSKQAIEAKERIDSELADLASSVSKNSTLGVKIRWLRGVLAKSDQFAAKIRQFRGDHRTLVESFGDEQTLDERAFNAFAERVQALRNALAHGNMDIDYDEDLVLDSRLLEKIVLAIQLINIGIRSDCDVSDIIRYGQ